MYTPRVVLDRYRCLCMGPQLAPTQAKRAQACSLTRFLSLSLSLSVALSKLLQFSFFVLNPVYIYCKQPIRHRVRLPFPCLWSAFISLAIRARFSAIPFCSVSFGNFNVIVILMQCKQTATRRRADILPLLAFCYRLWNHLAPKCELYVS